MYLKFSPWRGEWAAVCREQVLASASWPRGSVKVHFGLGGHCQQPCGRRGSQHTHQLVHGARAQERDWGGWLTVDGEVSLPEEQMEAIRVSSTGLPRPIVGLG